MDKYSAPLKISFDKFIENNALKSFMRLPFSRELEGVDIAVAGVPFDLATTNRAGTRFGPGYLRDKGLRSAISDVDLDINISENLKCVDYGDFELQLGYLPDSFYKITQQTKEILDAGATPIIVGGDHAITFPELEAFYYKYGKMALVHFDSHLDTGRSIKNDETRDFYHHGNPFYWALRRGYVDGNHMIQLGIRGGFMDGTSADEFSKEHGREYILAKDLHRMSYDEAAKRIRDKVGDMPVFVTFDIDFLDPAYAPGTGTPVVGGFSVARRGHDNGESSYRARYKGSRLGGGHALL